MEWAACGTFGGAGRGSVQTDGAQRFFVSKAGDGGYQRLGIGMERRAEDPLCRADFDKFA
jgi:hypothetical protein